MRLKNVVTVCVAVEQMIFLFGVTDEFEDEWMVRKRTLAEAICHEQGVQYGTSSAASLPEDTELGEISSKLFGELKTWVKSQGDHFRSAQFA